MNGDPKVLIALRGLIKSEFQAMAQYRLQAQTFKHQGYGTLKHKLHGFYYDENDHAKKLLNRLLFLGGTAIPSDSIPPKPEVGNDVVEMFNSDLSLEIYTVQLYNQAARVCMDANDFGTAHILHKLIRDEEEHTDWFERQLSIINDVGKEQYLADRA